MSRALTCTASFSHCSSSAPPLEGRLATDRTGSSGEQRVLGFSPPRKKKKTNENKHKRLFAEQVFFYYCVVSTKESPCPSFVRLQGATISLWKGRKYDFTGRFFAGGAEVLGGVTAHLIQSAPALIWHSMDVNNVAFKWINLYFRRLYLLLAALSFKVAF